MRPWSPGWVARESDDTGAASQTCTRLRGSNWPNVEFRVAWDRLIWTREPGAGEGAPRMAGRLRVAGFRGGLVRFIRSRPERSSGADRLDPRRDRSPGGFAGRCAGP